MKNVLLLIVLLLSQVWTYANVNDLRDPLVEILKQDVVISGTVLDNKGGAHFPE